MQKIDGALQAELKTLIQSMGYELLGVTIVSESGKQIFRIYIDSPQGVSVDDCSQVSHQVSAVLDVEDVMQGAYHLEVSSPGIDRPLFEIDHFSKQIGCQVKIRLHHPIEDRRQYKGLLQRVEGENIYLLVEGMTHEVVLPFAEIEKANVIGDVRW